MSSAALGSVNGGLATSPERGAAWKARARANINRWKQEVLNCQAVISADVPIDSGRPPSSYSEGHDNYKFRGSVADYIVYTSLILFDCASIPIIGRVVAVAKVALSLLYALASVLAYPFSSLASRHFKFAMKNLGMGIVEMIPIVGMKATTLVRLLFDFPICCRRCYLSSQVSYLQGQGS